MAIEVEIEYHGETYRKYIGRLLGLITNKDLCALKKEILIRKRLLTAETVSIDEINAAGINATGLRIVASIRSINGENTIRKLLITEPIDMVATYTDSQRELGITCPNDHWLTIKELKKD